MTCSLSKVIERGADMTLTYLPNLVSQLFCWVAFHERSIDAVSSKDPKEVWLSMMQTGLSPISGGADGQVGSRPHNRSRETQDGMRLMS